MSPRVYERRFDWDEARRRVGAGEPVLQVARELGVTNAAIYRILDPARYERDRERVAAFQASGRCPDCGRQTTRLTVRKSSRCVECAAKLRVTSAREGELECVTCRLWKPDDCFSPARSQPARRGRHRQCRLCNNAAKRAYRKRNPGRG